MKTIIICVVFCSISISAFSQNRGIGLRLGNPMGITYKIYQRNKAVEFGLGSGYSSWYPHYYENSFHDFDRYEGYDFVSYHASSPLYFQARYLIQNDIQIEGMMGKLQWYWGIGGVLKLQNVEYRIRKIDVITTSARTDLDIGPEGILGMEYTFEDIPLTIFGEFSLFVEIVDRPAALRGFSGVGARYNFKL